MNFLLDNDGVVVEKYTYDVFGRPKIMGAGGEERASCHYNNRFLFQGREYMGEIGVYDYRNRFYHPELGRFLQVDPTGFDAGDMNLFRYVGDDPVDGSDPTGLVGMFPRLASDQGGEWITGANGLDTFANLSHRPQAGMGDNAGGGGGNDNRKFYGDVKDIANRKEMKGVDPVEVGHAVAADATEAAKETAKDIRREGKGYYGVERTAGGYVNSRGHLVKTGLDIGVNSRYTPHGFLPAPPPGFSPKDLLTGSHSHGPQSGQGHTRVDTRSADGQNKYGVQYISSVARSTNPDRVSIYVGGTGRFYHTVDGGRSFFIGP